MTAYPNTAFGGCHCGAIRYRVSGQPQFVGCCHCKDCRGTTGAPMAVFVTYSADNILFASEQRKIYASSPGVARTFCSNCGTPLSYEAEWAGQTVIGLHVSTFDEPGNFPPDKHVFDVDRINWFHVADTLPRYWTVPGEGGPINVGPSDGQLEDS